MRSAFIILALLVSESALAVNNANFWLPASYREWLPEMREQAEALERDEADCVSVIKSTLHESYSTRDNPVFRFVCRDSHNKSYSIIVDAVSHKRTYSNPMRSPEYRAKKEEEARLAKLAEAKKRLKAKRVDCENALQKKTRFMRDFTWVSDQFMEPQRLLLADVDPAKSKPKPKPKPKAKQGEAEEIVEEPQVWVFDGHFDAKDVQGRGLKYQARCLVFDDKETVTINIGRRVPASAQ
ncbi:hypothetical protein R50073_38720 [Maricurvus nonylphenolicus]|uniref:hypothetical protein n=1 Tax=Maricurvus nonylphenolicus TaxID=1008307 RepID=UPI0036F1EFE3